MYSPVKSPRSPMSVVRAHWTPESQGHIIYFRPREITGPGFGGDNPTVLAELMPLLEVIRASMEGTDFFISMIPEANYSFGSACIPDHIEVPAFAQAFAPIVSVLVAQGVQNDCDIEISVRTGRGGRFSDPTSPSMELSVYELIPAEFGRRNRQRLNLPISLDVNGAECKSILAWYAGAAHGMVSWKWKRTVEAQSAQVSVASPTLIA